MPPVPAGVGLVTGSFGGGLTGCVVSQPVSTKSAQSSQTRIARSWRGNADSLKCGFTLGSQYRLDIAMEGFLLLLLEAGVALAILIFIVWWTWPRRERDDGRHNEKDRPGH